MNVIEKMTLSEHFSPLEKEIIHYIFSHRDQILDMSINRLAQETYSSNASIIRLCQKLDLKGFKEFKIAFAKALEQRQQQIYVDYNYPFHSLETPSELIRDIASLSVSSIEACCRELDPKAVFQAANLIEASHHVLLFASGDSMIRAQSFENKLIKIGKFLTPTYYHGELETYSLFASSRDCALFITYSATAPLYVRAARILKSKKVPILTVTANPDSTLARLSTCVIAFPNLEDQANSIATFYSQIAIEYILNVIYSQIYTVHYQDNTDTKIRVDQTRSWSSGFSKEGRDPSPKKPKKGE